MGLTPPTAGEVLIDGEPHRLRQPRASVRAARDRMAIVFQQYNLFQNMDVLGNVTIAPIKIKGRPRAEVEAEARQLLAKVGLADKHHAYPDQLSGGQQQRVAIARALALQPGDPAARRGDLGARPRARQRGARHDPRACRARA